jgi:ABC-type Na+ efflux pump permease subunit
MREILTLSMREVSRLRQRFSGGVSPVAILLLLGVIGLSIFSFRGSAVLGDGLYRLAVAGDVPPIEDGRFEVVKVTEAEGHSLLAQGAVDVFINGKQVFASTVSQKSQYALRALKSPLEKAEIQRVGTAYAYDLAFPLRVNVEYLAPGAAVASGEGTNTPITETIIPSLTVPPAPFTQVLVALLYILPVTFISIFFTGSFMDEKVNRRLVILLSTPITPFQIILGKMLPYTLFSVLAIIIIAVATHANVLMALAIFTPTTLFIFAIYLLVPMFYRTYKDTTFISMMVTTLTTAYLVFPAMFTGMSELAYMSPLTLAVKMYQGETFGWREYMFPSLPMVIIFGLSMYSGTRLLNEEFLMGYRPLTRKLADAIFLSLNRKRPYLSVALLSGLAVPVVYVVQLVLLAIASNLPTGSMLVAMLFASVMVEEVIKSMGVVTLADRGVVRSVRGILVMAFLSGLGFLIGEKLLLFTSISTVSNLPLFGLIFNTGPLLLVPLLAHFVFTTLVSMLAIKTKIKYLPALLIGTILHGIYNWIILRGGM